MIVRRADGDMSLGTQGKAGLSGVLARLLSRGWSPEDTGMPRPEIRKMKQTPPTRDGEGGTASTRWVQHYHPRQSVPETTLFAIGAQSDPRVARFLSYLHRRGWSMDVCDDADAAIASLVMAPARWGLIVVFASRREDHGECWDDLHALLPHRPLMRVHLGTAAHPARVEFGKGAGFALARGMRGLPDSGRI